MGARFLGKTVIVTGGTSGIGAACVTRFADEGASVIGIGTNGATGREPLRPGVSLRQCDVGDISQVEALVSDVVAKHGRIDVLVNNAGTAGGETVRLHELSYSTWDRVQAVNARGAFAMMRTVIPHMLAQGGGNVINVASIGSFRATPGAVAYLSSKGAMLMLTRAAAVEYAKDNIRVNAVCPSTTDTPILAGLTSDTLERLVSRHPQGRLGRPEEVAALVAFLASDEAPHITGGDFPIDGGRSAT